MEHTTAFWEAFPVGSRSGFASLVEEAGMAPHFDDCFSPAPIIVDALHPILLRLAFHRARRLSALVAAHYLAVDRD